MPGFQRSIIDTGKIQSTMKHKRRSVALDGGPPRPSRCHGCFRAASLCRDGIGANFAGHGWVDHSAEEYVRAYFRHTNTIENYFSIFKRAVYGCHFHVSEWHLHRYAAERDFMYNNRIALGIDDLARADLALRGAIGKRLTYRDGIKRR
jgi:hypothetical protein